MVVGVQGAGLQWIYFLQPNAGIIELFWTRWISKYVARGASVGVKGRAIDVSDSLRVNWTMYQKANDLGELTDEDKSRILNDQSLLYDANPYKWADVEVDVNVYLEKLRSLMKDLEKEGVVF